MPKKTRKAKIRAAQRSAGTGYAPAPSVPAPSASGPSAPTPTAQPGRVAPVSRGTAAPTSLKTASPPITDYGYVFRDLRRIAALAVFFFGLMVLLWFLVEVQGIHLIPGLF